MDVIEPEYLQVPAANEEITMHYRSGSTMNALSGYLQLWKERGETEACAPQAKPAFTIAVSRQAGARGTTTARAVGERLGWAVYDRELVERIAQDMKLQARLLEEVDEKRVGLLREFMESLSSAPVVNEIAYVHRLAKTIASLVAHGDCVLVGRGIAHILPVETTLRVRLVARVAWRVAAMSRQLGVSEEEAAVKVAAIDRQRVQFVREHFNKDTTEPSLYDLVLNVERFSVEQCADLIVEALHRLQAAVAAKTSEPAALGSPTNSA
jgi:cytidylate kinase